MPNKNKITNDIKHSTMHYNWVYTNIQHLHDETNILLHTHTLGTSPKNHIQHTHSNILQSIYPDEKNAPNNLKYIKIHKSHTGTKKT